jgi:hypothetical protein
MSRKIHPRWRWSDGLDIDEIVESDEIGWVAGVEQGAVCMCGCRDQQVRHSRARPPIAPDDCSGEMGAH